MRATNRKRDRASPARGRKFRDVPVNAVCGPRKIRRATDSVHEGLEKSANAPAGASGASERRPKCGESRLSARKVPCGAGPAGDAGEKLENGAAGRVEGRTIAGRRDVVTKNAASLLEMMYVVGCNAETSANGVMSSANGVMSSPKTLMPYWK